MRSVKSRANAVNRRRKEEARKSWSRGKKGQKGGNARLEDWRSRREGKKNEAKREAKQKSMNRGRTTRGQIDKAARSF